MFTFIIETMFLFAPSLTVSLSSTLMADSPAIKQSCITVPPSPGQAQDQAQAIRQALHLKYTNDHFHYDHEKNFLMVTMMIVVIVMKRIMGEET